MTAFWSPTPRNRRLSNPSDGSGARRSNLKMPSYYYIIRVMIDGFGVAFHKYCQTRTAKWKWWGQSAQGKFHTSFPLLDLLRVSPRTVPWCWCVETWEGRHRRCPSSSSRGLQLHCSPIQWHLQPEIKTYGCTVNITVRVSMCLCCTSDPSIAFVYFWWCIIYMPDGKAAERRKQKAVYLFSDHFGLLVNLLAIGHITHKVMALCSRQSDFFSRFFEALLCSAPQDHLADSRTLSVWKQAGKYWTSEAMCSLKDKTGCVYSPLWTNQLVYGLHNFSGNETMKIIVQQCSFIQRTERPFSLQQIVFEQD